MLLLREKKMRTALGSRAGPPEEPDPEKLKRQAEDHGRVRATANEVVRPSGVDVGGEHGHQETDQRQPRDPRESGDQKPDRARELRNASHGDQEVRPRKLWRHHPNEVGPGPR